MLRTKKGGYRVPIDKDALKKFLVTGDFNVAQREITKVVFTVIKCYFSKYMDDREELEAMCIDYLYTGDRIKQYDPTGDAYNYLFTIFRNCIGNFIGRESRNVQICSDIVSDHERSYEETNKETDIPEDITDMILGDSTENYIQLKTREAIMVGVICYTPSRMPKSLTNLLNYRTPMDISQALVSLVSVLLQERDVQVGTEVVGEENEDGDLIEGNGQYAFRF